MLERATRVKNLGMYFDHNLAFDFHISEITRKCAKLLGFMLCKSRKMRQFDTFVSYTIAQPLKLEWDSIRICA